MNKDSFLSDHFTKEELLQFLYRSLNGESIYQEYTSLYIEKILKETKTSTLHTVSELSYNEDIADNRILEGDNLMGMLQLQKEQKQVDLILTDPPYNTGKTFRYQDSFSEWNFFMLPRLELMKRLLKESGVLAICIDHKELFQLGNMLDDVFGKENRIGIINWQKNYSPKNDSKHVSVATEYVLIYAKNITKAKTGLLPRSEEADAKYKNIDGDPKGRWRDNNTTASTRTEKDTYAIQSPFTGALHYPGAAAWRYPKAKIKSWLSEWGVTYVEKEIGDGRPKALMIQNSPIPHILEHTNLNQNPVVEDESVFHHPVIVEARRIATKKQETDVLPPVFFSKKGYGRLRAKIYLNEVKQGVVPTTFWADTMYEEPFEIGVQSWHYTESGHTHKAVNETDEIVGKGHQFKTLKPLQLLRKIIHLWCPPNGIVLDPFAGTGSTGQALLKLNLDTNTNRSFILMEQGNVEKEDHYTNSLTYNRILRSFTGYRYQKNGELQKSEEPIPGGFLYQRFEK